MLSPHIRPQLELAYSIQKARILTVLQYGLKLAVAVDHRTAHIILLRSGKQVVFNVFCAQKLLKLQGRS